MLQLNSDFLYLERWVNDGSPSGYTTNGAKVADPYSPRGLNGAFPLPFASVPVESVTVEGDRNLLESWYDRIDLPRGAGHIMIPIHPEVAESLPESAVRRTSYVHIPVIATSSSRTVAVKPDPSIHLKLHYPGIIGRSPRELNLRRVQRSVQVSTILQNKRPILMSSGLDYLEEPAGLVWNSPVGPVGALVRDAGVTVAKTEGSQVIPLFSMFSKDARRVGSDSLVEQFVKHKGHPHSAETLLRLLVFPLIESYFAMSIGCGLIPEAHAQNILVEFSFDQGVGTVYFRDLLDFVADLEFISEDICGPAMHYVRPGTDESAQWRSWAFDFKFSEYTLTPIVRKIAGLTDCGYPGLVRAVKSYVQEVLRTHGLSNESYFTHGNKVYYLKKRVPDWSHGPVFDVREKPYYR